MSQAQSTSSPSLDRSLSLTQAAAVNMIDMVGIGPFVSASLVISQLNGPNALWAWVLGAFLAMVDGMVWAQLGAALPNAGGAYSFLRVSFTGLGLGRVMSFLFLWQTLFQAPLVVASGAIGFAGYARNLVTFENPLAYKAISGGLVVAITVLLYRHIASVGRLSVVLWVLVLGTIAWLIVTGFIHGDYASVVAQMTLPVGAGSFVQPFSFLSDSVLALAPSDAFAGLLGMATVKTVYSYLGYYNVCHLGGEIKEPGRNIPRAIFISVAGIALLYLLMQSSILSLVDWTSVAKDDPVVGQIFNTYYGPFWGGIGNAMILFVAFASLFSVVLGYSRIPYAAAKEGEFFSVFAKVHPTLHFPHISLLTLCAVAFVFSLLFRMAEVISTIIAMRALIQFIGSSVGLLVLWREKGPQFFPYRMPLFPVPVIVNILLWLWLLLQTGVFALWGLIMIVSGLIAFVVWSRIRNRELKG